MIALLAKNRYCQLLHEMYSLKFIAAHYAVTRVHEHIEGKSKWFSTFFSWQNSSGKLTRNKAPRTMPAADVFRVVDAWGVDSIARAV